MNRKYPTINYIGNKKKIVGWIMESLPLSNGTVLDLFCGGCSVSFELKKRGFRVLSNDILYSNYVIAKTFIEDTQIPIDESILDVAVSEVELNASREKTDFLINKLYYDYEVEELANLIAISEKLDIKKQYLFLSLIRRSMIRKIPYSRMNIKWSEITKLRDEEYSYEKYKRRRAYHNEPFANHIKKYIGEYNGALSKNKFGNRAFQQDAKILLDNIDEKVDIVYIDPPYPSTMNKYHDFYGVYDDIFGKRINTTLDLTNKNVFIQNFKEIIQKSLKISKYVVVSINNRTKPDYLEIAQMMESFGLVEIKEINHVYRITGKENKNTHKEILIILKKG